MKKALLLLLCLSFFVGIQSGEAQRKKKAETTQPEPKPEAKKPKNGMKSYEDVITKEAVTDDGLFTVHHVDDKYYFEIADSLLGREILNVSRIAGITEGLSFGGAGMKAGGQKVFRLEKHGKSILLRYVSYSSVANEEDPIYLSVKSNNFEPIVESFKIETMSADSSSYVIDVSDFFVSDVQAISPLSTRQRTTFGVRSLDKGRSLIDEIKSYPLNTEVRQFLTFTATKLPSNASTGTLSLKMNQSFVLLPKKPMMPRLWDVRVNYFSVRQQDYSADEQKAARKQYVTRWRLEPKDQAAYDRGELVEPIKPIVYYVDPATPEKWRPWIKQGIEDWQVAFEAAGFKNAIIAKDPPSKEEDPDWSPEDVRYSVVRYISTTIQNAQGPHVHDPRSGEIIESDILWYHNVMNLLRNWYFVQTAAINPKAQAVKFDDEVMGELIKFVSSHEVGHTLGLPHNMGASWSYPVDSLRSATFTAKMGTAPSIMDYARFNYIAQPGDNAALMPGIGIYDKHAINWAYRKISSATSPEAELPTLNKWITDHGDDNHYRFGVANGIDPSAQTEDLGDNSVKASEYGVANLKRIVPNLIKWTQADGKNYDDLDELYSNVIGQFRRYVGHVSTNVGGVYTFNKTYDQSGAVNIHVDKAMQKSAVKFMNDHVFTTQDWLLDKDITSRITNSGVIDRISSLQTSGVSRLINESRLERMVENELLNGRNAYTATEMFGDLRTGIWSELRTGASIDPFRRKVQRAHIESLGRLIDTKSDVGALCRAELVTLRRNSNAAVGRTSDSMSKYHLQDMVAVIDRMLDPK